MSHEAPQQLQRLVAESTWPWVQFGKKANSREGNQSTPYEVAMPVTVATGTKQTTKKRDMGEIQ